MPHLHCFEPIDYEVSEEINRYGERITKLRMPHGIHINPKEKCKYCSITLEQVMEDAKKISEALKIMTNT